MKKMIWLVLMAALSASVVAQQATDTPPPAPAALPTTPPAVPSAEISPPVISASTNAPAKHKVAGKAKKKSVGKKQAKPHATKTEAKADKAPAAKPATLLKTEPLLPGPATVIVSNVNVRGQARLAGEVVTHLTKGQAVTVLEEITLTNSAPDEPSAWAKILLPSERPVWINGMFTSTNNEVTATRVNLRSGPGENYSVLGRLKKGETFKELERKQDWIKIEAPTNAYAFVAAQYLKSDVAAPAAEIAAAVPAAPAPPATPEPAPTPTAVAETPAIAPAPTTPPVVATPEPAPAPVATTPPPAPPTPEPAVVIPTPAPEPAPSEAVPPPKRIVQREGVVRGTVSIQAPSPFGLVNTETGRTMDYLVSPSKDFDLRRFKGIRVIVTGEEGLDQRWGNTPVLTIDKIEPIE
ncbi:MAG: SH3 domain-containing protein [Verrucomicrobia bacterium]|nr:SH3 domain-containing protein [Verrucomicrobiota bacterium]